MERQSVTVRVWALFVAVLCATLLALAPRAAAAQGPPPPLPPWQQANTSGFGTPKATDASALAFYNDYLYAGTHNATDGARIYRSHDGTTWTPVTDAGMGVAGHDVMPLAILDLSVFQGYLYAGTGRGANPGQVWRTLDGLNWAQVVNHGFHDNQNVDIAVYAEYEAMLYAGVGNSATGAQIWRSSTGDSNSWTQVAPETAGGDGGSVTGMVEFDTGLYAAVQSNSAPVQIWRSFGGGATTWAAVVSDGFDGTDPATLAGGMAVFGAHLYVGAGNGAGARIWRTSDGEVWTPVGDPAFGDANNELVESLFVFDNQLYAAIRNAVTGLELWRSADGTAWERANADGFGDAGNTTSNRSNAQAQFRGQLHIGVQNSVDGGEVWRMLNTYGVALSADSALSGMPGSQVVYSLSVTNTGTLTDVVALGLSGQSWSTTLGESSLNLAPFAGTTFTVSVSIPADAPNFATDTVTVTAVSQGDTGKSDKALLTTTAKTPPVATHALTVTIAGSGGGSVLGIPANPNAIAHGTVITLTAQPNASSSFAGWTGGCLGLGNCVVVMDQPRSVTANFSIRTHALTLTFAGQGSGSVQGLPANLNAIPHGTVVQLTAQAAIGSVFVGWSGSGCTGKGACSLTMDAAKALTVTFAIQMVEVTLPPATVGGIVVAEVVTPTVEAGAVASSFPYGTLLRLTAQPNDGYRFGGWAGSLSGNANPKLVTVQGPLTVMAKFELITYPSYLPTIVCP